MSISPGQCRAARGLLAWNQDELADAASAGRRTVVKFERGEPVTLRTVADLRRALEAAGIEFLDDDGVKGRGVRLVRQQIDEAG